MSRNGLISRRELDAKFIGRSLVERSFGPYEAGLLLDLAAGNASERSKAVDTIVAAVAGGRWRPEDPPAGGLQEANASPFASRRRSAAEPAQARRSAGGRHCSRRRSPTRNSSKKRKSIAIEP